jgi:uncharacterized protein (DUF1778 family)
VEVIERETIKDTRLHVRCKRADKEKIEKAAAALGLSLSDYMLSNALAQAERRAVPEPNLSGRLPG